MPEELVELKGTVETIPVASADVEAAERGFSTMNVITLLHETAWVCIACQTFSL